MKEKFNNNMLGVAGELRVMSELLLRGFNPAKSYLDNGTDILLSNGLKLQVKARHKQIKHNQNYYGCELMSTRYKKGKAIKDRRNYVDINFLILWGIDTNSFYIIPINIIKDKTSIAIPIQPAKRKNGGYYRTKHQYHNFKDNWDLLKNNPKDEEVT